MAIQNVARLLRADIDDTQPILDSRLPDGSRVAAIYANGAMNVTIRKFNRWFSTDDLDRSGCFPNSISSVVVNGLLGKDQKEKANVLISGGTGSGKTTLAKALIDRMPMTDRLIVIERPKELSIQHPAALHLEAVEGVPGSVAPRTVAQLLVASLRHRPDRIIIGEVREPLAAYELLQALNTGHSGSISTIHADSASDALIRLTDLALASHSNLTQEFVSKRVLACINFVVHIARQATGRKVIEVIQIVDKQESKPIYSLEEELATCR